MKISAIILAAGCSKRMGKPKVLMPVHKKPMFIQSVELAIESKLSPIYVIGGRHFKQINSTLQGYSAQTIFNKDYEKGMSTSLKLGIKAVTNQCDATVILLGDQPLTPKIVVEKLIKSYLDYYNNGTKIVRPMYKGKPGHPILFDSSLFNEFGLIKGDVGGREIIKRHKKKVRWLQFDEEDWGMDIDTLNEYHLLLDKINS